MRVVSWMDFASFLLASPLSMRHCQLPPTVPGVFMRASLSSFNTSCTWKMTTLATEP